MVLTGSFTTQESILRDGFRIIPKEFSIEAYKIIFESPDMLAKSYWSPPASRWWEPFWDCSSPQ
jgi:ABC-type glycerol-3-phosphate transport system permease component